jgi:hypothetical protein
MQDAQDDRNGSVINRNHLNQSMSTTTQVSDDLGQSSPLCTDYGDDIDYIDYTNYSDYAHESVLAYWSQIHKPDPPPIGTALQYLSEAGDLLTEKEDIQGTQDRQVDYTDDLINSNQSNQSELQP